MVLKIGSFFEDTELWEHKECQKMFGRYECEDNKMNVSNIQGEWIVRNLLISIGKVFAAPGCMTAALRI